MGAGFRSLGSPAGLPSMTFPATGTGGGGIDENTPLQSRAFYADQLDVPVNSDWAVSAIAPSDLDSTVASAPIIEMDDTVEQGRGWFDNVPAAVDFVADAATLKLGIVSKAGSLPPGAKTVGLKLYYREYPDNGAVGAWKNIVLNDIDIPANTNFQYDTQTLTIGAGAGQLDVTPGTTVQFELTRVAPGAGTNLTGDLHLHMISATWAAA